MSVEQYKDILNSFYNCDCKKYRRFLKKRSSLSSSSSSSKRKKPSRSPSANMDNEEQVHHAVSRKSDRAKDHTPEKPNSPMITGILSE